MGVLARTARWCFRHRLAVLLLWVAVLLGAIGGSTATGADYANDFSLPGTDSTRATDLLVKAFPDQAGDTDTMVWRSEGPVRDAAVRERIEPALAKIARLDGVGQVAGPYAKGPAAAAQISRDGHTAFARITLKEPANTVPKELIQDIVNIADRVDSAGSADAAGHGRADDLRVELGGQAIVRVQEPPSGLAELVGLGAAAVVLFLAFGSLYSMLLPIGVAIFAVGTGLSLTTLLTHVTDIPEIAPLLGSLIGLGVGIDYALFIVTRHRRGLLRGEDPEESAVRALNTSGRAVLFAGGTVCIALAGMLVMNMRFLDGVVVATSLTVVMSVLGAITLLPALLGMLGPRVLSRRQRRRLDEHGPESEEPSGLAARWAAAVQRRPWSVAVLGLVVMLALSLPLLSLRLGATDQGNHKEERTTRQAYDLLAEGFGPGFNGPLQVVVESGDAKKLFAKVEATEGVARAMAAPPSHGITVIQVVPKTSPQSAKTDALIDRLRDEAIPDSGTKAHVGGVTAVFKDFATVTQDRLPWFVAAIVGLGFVLLLVAFRSLMVPLTAGLMNLLAAASSFGVLVAIFQWGWGAEALGVGKEGPITAFLPVIMLSLLFGLSMDYQVFLVSRMHEEWAHTGDNARAVRVGLAETSRVINSAALIMICVFTAFVLSGDMEATMAGVGLAVAVALDAFILRTALVPAAMYLFGRSNWWLPAWLDRRLPHLSVEPADERPEPAGWVPEQKHHGGVVPESPCEMTMELRGGPVDADPVSWNPYDLAPGLPEGVAPRLVHGFVRTSEGANSPGAVVALLSAGGRQLDRTRSLADGSYALDAPGPGTYLLVASDPRTGARARHITVQDRSLTQDLHLADAGAEVGGG